MRKKWREEGNIWDKKSYCKGKEASERHRGKGKELCCLPFLQPPSSSPPLSLCLSHMLFGICFLPSVSVYLCLLINLHFLTFFTHKHTHTSIVLSIFFSPLSTHFAPSLHFPPHSSITSNTSDSTRAISPPSTLHPALCMCFHLPSQICIHSV